MTCELIFKDGVHVGYSCGRNGYRLDHGVGVTQCSVPGCGARATHACDFKLRGKAEGRTCDRPLCGAAHAKRVGPGIDYCPAHAAMSAEGGK